MSVRSPAERRAASTPFAIPTDQVRPRVCPVCGCTYLDYGPGIDAHRIVFGHAPVAEE